MGCGTAEEYRGKVGDLADVAQRFQDQSDGLPATRGATYMQMSAAVRRNSVWVLVELRSLPWQMATLVHTPHVEGVSLMIDREGQSRPFGHDPHGTTGLLVSRPDDLGLAHQIMCWMLGAAAAAVSWRSISLVRLAAPASAPDLGCY